MDKIKITDIKFYYFDTSYKGGRIRAYAEVTFNNSLIIKGVQIIETDSGGFFPNFPQKRMKGEWNSYIGFANKDFEKELRTKIIVEFKKYQEKNEG